MRIVTRAEWGAVTGRPLALYAPGSVKGVVYHWNGPPVDWDADQAGVVRSTQRYHIDTQGWRDIAYNFAIAYDGTVYEGRGINYRNGASGHATPNNEFVAVEFMMGVGQSLTPAMIEAARDLNTYIRTVHPNATRQTVHNDWFNTMCPGPEITDAAHNGVFVRTTPPSGDDEMTPEQMAEIKAHIDARYNDLRTHINGVGDAVVDRLFDDEQDVPELEEFMRRLARLHIKEPLEQIINDKCGGS